jgi:hypothetical protein
VQDGKNGAVVDRVEELVGVPTRGKRTGFGFAITDDARDKQIGVIE